MAQPCADVLTMIRHSARAIFGRVNSRIRWSRQRRIASIGAFGKLKFSEQMIP